MYIKAHHVGEPILTDIELESDLEVSIASSQNMFLLSVLVVGGWASFFFVPTHARFSFLPGTQIHPVQQVW